MSLTMNANLFIGLTISDPSNWNWLDKFDNYQSIFISKI